MFYCESRSFVVLLVDTTCDILKALDSYCLSCQDIVHPVQKPLPHNELLRSIVHQKPITGTVIAEGGAGLLLYAPSVVYNDTYCI